MATSDDLDREVCMCHHVRLRKLIAFHRLHAPRVASQLSQCYGAGTGCGWCVPFLQKIFEQLESGEVPRMKMSAEEYRRRRSNYHETGTRD
jgi:bacterioferritin-associated ferredoxin